MHQIKTYLKVRLLPRDLVKYSHNIFHDKQTMFCKWPEEAAIKQLIWEKAHTLPQPNYLLTYLLFPLHGNTPRIANHSFWKWC